MKNIFLRYSRLRRMVKVVSSAERYVMQKRPNSLNGWKQMRNQGVGCRCWWWRSRPGVRHYRSQIPPHPLIHLQSINLNSHQYQYFSYPLSSPPSPQLPTPPLWAKVYVVRVAEMVVKAGPMDSDGLENKNSAGLKSSAVPYSTFSGESQWRRASMVIHLTKHPLSPLPLFHS